MPRATSARPPGRSSWSSAIEAVKTFATTPGLESKRLVPCALCGGSTFVPYWDCSSFAFARCASCGLVQQNPQSLPEAIADRYDGRSSADYLRYEEEHQYAYRDLELRALADLGLDAEAAPLFERAKAEGRAPRVLDVGCATGALLASLRDSGWDPQGVEISKAQASYGEERHHLPIYAGSLEDARFPDASFDFVHASHLIEHLNDPSSFVREVGRVLAPGGILVLTTPRVDGFQARLLGHRWRSAIYDHLYLFSLRTLGSLLGSASFSVEKRVTWGGWAAGLKPAFIKAPMDALAKRLGFGDVMAILARRVL